jgi:hypothetical protein
MSAAWQLSQNSSDLAVHNTIIQIYICYKNKRRAAQRQLPYVAMNGPNDWVTIYLPHILFSAVI